jgi:photosystem II stability/assembly factor-like uncharacterized protein
MGLTLSGRQRNTGRIPLAALFVAVVVGRTTPARADGAFPSAQAVLLPRDRPSEIVLGTTFGLVFTEDDGSTWRYACENTQTRMGRQYTVGSPPDDRIYALSDLGVPVTADGACTWTVAGGDLFATLPVDVFPDPSDAARVFALAVNSNDGLVSAYRSTDAGLTYAGPIFTSPASGTVTGIEVAASAPRTVFITLYERPGLHPRLARSDDGGDTWTTADIEPGIGAVIPFLVAVDPVDSRRITLRITSGASSPQQFQGLAITTDGGATWTTPLVVSGGSLTGFARSPDGTILAVGTIAPTMDGGTGVPSAFRSDDGGLSFTTQPLSFHPAGLAQRDGTFYVATNDFLDGFALASSIDRGQTWTPRLRFRDIAGTKDCVRASCQDDCDYLAGVNLFPPETCNPPPKKAGCGCGLGTNADPQDSIATASLLLLAGWLVDRRFKRVRS